MEGIDIKVTPYPKEGEVIIVTNKLAEGGDYYILDVDEFQKVFETIQELFPWNTTLGLLEGTDLAVLPQSDVYSLNISTKFIKNYFGEDTKELEKFINNIITNFNDIGVKVIPNFIQ